MMIPRRELAVAMTGAAMTGACLVGLTLLGLQAMADGDPTTDNVPRLIPYNGVLKTNGAPVTATGEDAPWLRFDITDGEEAQAPVVYSQSMQVNAYDGRFTALLGPTDDDGVAIDTVIGGADRLYLRMAILNTHNPNDPASTADDDVALMNTQLLTLSPYALWATHATSFDVAGALTAANVAVTTLDTQTLHATAATLTTAEVTHLHGNEATGELAVASRLSLSGAGTPVEGVDTLDHYKLLLAEGSQPANSFGLTNRGASWVANVPADGHYAFYQNGSNLRLRISQSLHTAVASNLFIYENLILDTLNVQGNAPLTISNLQVREDLILDPNHAVTNAATHVEVNDTLRVTGDLIVNGDGLNDFSRPNSNRLTIDDNLNAPGGLNFGVAVRACNPTGS
ncbi:MAG: hypothetical protein AAFX99_18210, partial [Myxococcota bacterium]